MTWQGASGILRGIEASKCNIYNSLTLNFKGEKGENSDTIFSETKYKLSEITYLENQETTNLVNPQKKSRVIGSPVMPLFS